MAMHAHSPAGEKCMICGEIKLTGIHICNQLICDSCHNQIVKTDVGDWKYQYYMKKLSKLKLKSVDDIKEHKHSTK
ncbi:sigma-G inhibitor, Gin [Sporolactobacillus sp. THM7-4]|nr:sigma-G inhibitor, Gin [Sporolactobacillus sp. THM7-4]